MRTPKKTASALLNSQVVLIQTAHSWVNASISNTKQQSSPGKQVTVPEVPVLEWDNTSTLSELFSAVNKLSGLFNITCNSFAVSDNNIDYMTSGASRTVHYQLASNKLGLLLRLERTMNLLCH